jgi:hypothetical protein
MSPFSTAVLSLFRIGVEFHRRAVDKAFRLAGLCPAPAIFGS